MFEAMKKADVKASEVDSFLTTLLAEHDAAGARAQLKTLWMGHVRTLLQLDEDAHEGAGSSAVGGGGVRATAETPPDSPQGAGP